MTYTAESIANRFFHSGPAVVRRLALVMLSMAALWSATIPLHAQTIITTENINGSSSVGPQALYSFGELTNNADGYQPKGGVVLDSAGNIYGTTWLGGSTGTPCNKSSGESGIVFKLNTSNHETVLCSFSGALGAYPMGNLVRDSSGNLYGIAMAGGALNLGLVFKLSTSNQLTTLHTFEGQSAGDGADPVAGLVMDSAGNLYGTTEYGGANNFGIVFKVNPTTKQWTILHTFLGYLSGDGQYPMGGLVLDSAGNIYGTTYEGGSRNLGTVFTVSPSGEEKVLHSFEGSTASPADGALPMAGLVLASGYLYGTTENGGVYNLGTAFKLSTSGATMIEYDFQGGTDGSYPLSGLVKDSAGNFYGTTSAGGNGGCGTQGCGAVFKLNSSLLETALYAFDGLNGQTPHAGLAWDSAHKNLYGTTELGGTHGAGVVFKLTP